ncbi:hypothetical protein K3495_g5873 [Podosphaera aphanis]|nr:hypothetical protein K3495_g5873 [Podosphaera aphanis]
MSTRRKTTPSPPPPAPAAPVTHDAHAPRVVSRALNQTAPAVPAHVIVKLLGFTVAMIAGPISCYFLSLNKIFAGNSTYAGATAAITANLVLIGYVMVAIWEDQGEESLEKKEN